MHHSPMGPKVSVFRLLAASCLHYTRRFHPTSVVKFAFYLSVLYLLNAIFGVQYYVWPEKSFEHEYHLDMTSINIAKLDENHPEKSLGLPIHILTQGFAINNEYFCNNGSRRPHLLILVKSAISNRRARQAIRMTWGNVEVLTTHNIRLAFVLGTGELNSTAERESQRFKDIIQIDKVDFYYHNSYKMVMMLRWISQYCTFPTDLRTYVLFVDDDYYVDIDSLKRYIKKVDDDPRMTTHDRRTFITGHVYRGSRPRRFINDRWYISVNDYPYDHYPPYVTAGCFLMTRANARLFYIASKYTPLFRFDDIYMGMLAYSMSIKPVANNDLFSSYGVSPIVFKNQTGIFSALKRMFTDPVELNSTNSPICIHGYRGDDLIDIWNHIYRTNLTLSRLF